MGVDRAITLGRRNETVEGLMPEPDVEPVCVMHETKGPLIYERVPRDAASVRCCLMEDNQIAYRTFYLTGERDAEGRPIYRERLA